MIHSITRINSARVARLLAAAFAPAALAVAMLAAPAHAGAQQMELFNRLVQTGGNDAASATFDQARGQINEQKWAQASSTLNRFISEHPSDRNLDAAMYWLAYAYEKQNKNREAEGVLTDLLMRFPRSTWVGDASALRLKVKTKLGEPVNVPDNADDDLRIIALQALCQNDRATCSARVSDVLRSNTATPRVKEAAIILLGRYGGTEAVPSLIQMSRSEANDKLRMRAIRALGSTNDERALDVLREIGMSAEFDDESPTDSALHALREHESARAVNILGDIAINGRNIKGRQHAITLLSQRAGEPAVDELFRIYDAVQDVEVRKYVVAGLGNRKSPRAAERLVTIARSAPEVELRRSAFRSLGHRDEEQYLDVLISLYDTERDNDLKNAILQSIGQHQNPRANQKLMQIVRSTAEPIERRKTAISILSRSKDPQVLQFLQDMLK